MIKIIIILLFSSSVCFAQSEVDFQKMKKTVTDQIIGSQATVSEVNIPKFTNKDIENIKKAQKQLVLIGG